MVKASSSNLLGKITFNGNVRESKMARARNYQITELVTSMLHLLVCTIVAFVTLSSSLQAAQLDTLWQIISEEHGTNNIRVVSSESIPNLELRPLNEAMDDDKLLGLVELGQNIFG